MPSSPPAVADRTLSDDAIPESLDESATVLVAASANPTRAQICLRLLTLGRNADHTALTVTTTESSEQTIETYNQLGDTADLPSLRLVDSASEEQSISALYDETPVVFTPAHQDVERLVMALSDLTRKTASTNHPRHLVVRSLTPILEATSTSQVCRVLERITGLPSDRGCCLLGLDYTAHDEATMTELADHVDGILWVTGSPSAGIEFEYQATRGRRKPLVPGGSTDE